MMEAKEDGHKQAKQKLMELMKTDGAVESWMLDRRKEFEGLPEF